MRPRAAGQHRLRRAARRESARGQRPRSKDPGWTGIALFSERNASGSDQRCQGLCHCRPSAPIPTASRHRLRFKDCPTALLPQPRRRAGTDCACSAATRLLPRRQFKICLQQIENLDATYALARSRSHILQLRARPIRTKTPTGKHCACRAHTNSPSVA